MLLARLQSGDAGPQPDDLIELGRIAEPYGVKGWVNVLPHSADATTLKHAKRWYLRWAPAPGRREATAVASVLQSRMHSGRLVAQLNGIDDRSLAEGLKGVQVWISRSSFPPLKKGEFYWVDLVGLAVVNREGIDLGRVTEVTDHGAHPILCIQPMRDGLAPDPADRPVESVATAERNAETADAEERLIPFVDAYIDQVDMANRLIRVDWQADY